MITKDKEGRTSIDFPGMLGVEGELLLPVWAGAIAAMVGNDSIEVERMDDDAAVTSG